MAKPVMIFIHGAWHSPAYFDRVIAKIEPLGYKCVVPSMLSVGTSPPITSLHQDIDVIRNAVTAELDAGLDVIVHMHSWGGIPASSALDGLSKAEREKEGKKGVVKMIFVTSFVLPEGVSLADAVGGPKDWWIFSNDGTTLMPDDPTTRFYNDLDPADASHWASQIRPHSTGTFIGDQAKTISAAWKKIPSAYLICENDNAIPFQGQEAMTEAMKEGGCDVDIERIAASHSPHLSKPGAVADFIIRAAEKAM